MIIMIIIFIILSYYVFFNHNIIINSNNTHIEQHDKLEHYDYFHNTLRTFFIRFSSIKQV